MAATKVSDLVRGAGMFVNFVSVLTEELIKVGGSPEMIYFSQKEYARPLMTLMAKTIVSSKLWRIPFSLVLAEIEKGQSDKEWLEQDKKHFWTTFSPTAYDVTVLRFAEDPSQYDYKPQRGIPEEVAKQVAQEGFGAGTLVKYEGVEYVVTYAELDGTAIFLAPAKYFDPEC